MAIKNTAVDVTIAVTAVDTFVYDTRKDSDGGAWRKRTQHTSWYNETLNTATRGSRKEFPTVAVIVAESGTLTIYDGDDPSMPMWMVFNGFDAAWAGPMLVLFNSNRPAEATSALNGIVCLGNISGNDSESGLFAISFLKDSTIRYASYGPQQRIQTIADRDVITPNQAYNGAYTIVNGSVHDIAMTVLPNAPIDSATGLPVPTIALATNGGVSVIKDDGSVHSLSGGAIETISINDRHEFITTPTNYSDTMLIKPLSTSDANLDWNTGLRGYSNNPATSLYPFLSYRQSNTVATPEGFTFSRNIGDDGGVTLMSEDFTNARKSLQAVITSDYNTGYMVGDTKLATLSDTDATDVVGTNLIATSTLDSTDRLASHTYTSGSATFSLTEDSNAGTAAGYVWILFNVPLGKSYAVSIQCDTAFTPDGETRLVSVTTGVDVFPGQGTTDLRTLTFDHNNANAGVILYGSPVAGSTVTYTLSISEAEADRSVNGNGLQVFGTITKTPVATGADLVGYSGFSGSNYLEQPYNSDLDFGGTDSFSVSFWAKKTGNAEGYVMDRSAGDGTSRLGIYFISQTGLSIYTPDSQISVSETPANAWFQCTATRSGGILSCFVNGVLKGTVANAQDLTIGSPLVLGVRFNITDHLTDGSLALFRISATAPTAEQIAKIYNDEKPLFQENAQATLYGTSDAVTALAYDDDTELLHAGTSSGRSVFQGLRRVDNTTDAVTTSISASNSIIVEE